MGKTKFRGRGREGGPEPPLLGYGFAYGKIMKNEQK